jgi:hypothetical protein
VQPVIANRIEAESLAGSIHAAGAAIVTLGADGCLLIERSSGDPRRPSLPSTLQAAATPSAA